MTITDAPPSVHDRQDPLSPRGPWSFLRASVRGGGSPWGLGLLGFWAAFFLVSNVFWAIHLKALTGWSSLPNYWGELLTAQDLWELLENAGLRHHWSGPLVPVAAFGTLAGFLWAGWHLQAARVGLVARFAPWVWGFLDALLLSAIPLALLGNGVIWALNQVGTSGIQGLSWLDWVGGFGVRMACLSALFLQWWICRLGRAQGLPGWTLGGVRALRAHLSDSFLRFWLHPVQWGILVLGGVILRTGLAFLVLVLAWRWGGGTPVRVGLILVLQLGTVVLNGWLIGWFLRLTALFWHHDVAVRAVIRELEADLGSAP